jgi:glutaconate CoA-transferase subunit B
VITNLAVLGIDKTTGCLQVSGLMPGISIDQVQDNTGFELMSSADLSSIQPPTAEELCLLREEVDPEGEYIGSSE